MRHIGVLLLYLGAFVFREFLAAGETREQFGDYQDCSRAIFVQLDVDVFLGLLFLL